MFTSCILYSTQACNPNEKTHVSSNCRQYKECGQTGEEVTNTCPDGQVFNCLSNTCGSSVWPSCCQDDPDVNTYPVDTSCPINGLTMGNSGDCSKYNTCSDGDFIEMTCPANQHFDSKKTQCVDGPCVQPRALDVMPALNIIPASNNNTNSTNSTVIVCTKNEQKWANVDSCSTYFKCNYGNPVLKTCPLGSVYNCFFGRCSFLKYTNCCSNDAKSTAGLKSSFCYMRNKTVVDPRNNTQYFQCSGNTIVTRSCSNGTQYIPELFQCGNRSAYLNFLSVNV